LKWQVFKSDPAFLLQLVKGRLALAPIVKEADFSYLFPNEFLPQIP
jgi:hypothetical protein